MHATTEGEPEWRRVRVWFGEFAIADSTCVSDLADKLEALHRQRFARLLITNEPVTPPD
ncbi:hypothetical protein [Kribbella italica]|uniref:Uncharacterized protein n=1 Tax=Kribbella italica TaxID=1540520 RepID=A0A7W9J0F9_9ACTN|nr:hypothetical protein [Kribbella italica]MBB5833377.1 hypothetical protein [Kribbella italica]